MSRPFFETLRELRAGRTLEELQDSLAQVVTAVQTTNKPGELVLKLRVRPPRKGQHTYVSIEDDIVTKVPKSDREDTIFFPLADGSLSRQDPSQLRLGLSAVSSADVDPETGEIISQRSA